MAFYGGLLLDKMQLGNRRLCGAGGRAGQCMLHPWDITLSNVPATPMVYPNSLIGLHTVLFLLPSFHKRVQLVLSGGLSVNP